MRLLPLLLLCACSAGEPLEQPHAPPAWPMNNLLTPPTEAAPPSEVPAAAPADAPAGEASPDAPAAPTEPVAAPAPDAPQDTPSETP